MPGKAGVVGSRSHGKAHLARQQNLLATTLQRLPDDLLSLAASEPEPRFLTSPDQVTEIASDLGPGATVLFRANYLAAPKFSGGGRAAFSLDLGLGLDVRLAGRLHGVVEYAFERVNRKTDPGGTGEIAAPIQQTLARVGLAIGW